MRMTLSQKTGQLVGTFNSFGGKWVVIGYVRPLALHGRIFLTPKIPPDRPGFFYATNG